MRKEVRSGRPEGKARKKEVMTIDIVIAARARSKGIYSKNTMLLAGKPLIEYTLEAALGASGVRNIILSTDDVELAKACKMHGRIKPVLRPAKLSGDNTSVKDVLSHAVKSVGARRPEYLLLLFPTAPLRTSKDLNSAIRFAGKLPCFDSVVGVTKAKISPFGGLLLDKTKKVKFLLKTGGRYYRRQDQPAPYRLNGALFIVKTDRIGKLNDMLISAGTYGFEMDEISSVDIDTPYDVAVAEAMISFRKECLSHTARGGFNVQRLYIHDDPDMGIRRNVFDTAAYQRHFGRYRYFLPHIRTSDSVLDIACGSGYGSEILASKAKFVQGVDIDPETIKYARRHHRKPNVRFSTSRAERFHPRMKFDKVISIETIEHLPDPEGYLLCVAKWLKPGGQAWMTCPFSGSEEDNPFHISELTRERLEAAMRVAFKDIKFLDLGGSGIFTVDTLKNKVTYIVARGTKK